MFIMHAYYYIYSIEMHSYVAMYLLMFYDYIH